MSKYLWLVVQVLAWCVGTITLLGKPLALVMVPIGIWTGWKSKVTWAWDALESTKTGSYYDRWYDILTHENHYWLSRWAHQHSEFTKEYYWRVRNSFSNGERWMWHHTPLEDLVTVESKYGVYQYDRKYKWMSRIDYQFPITKTHAIYFEVGFKVNRGTGSGFTNRMIPFPFPFRIRRINY